MKILKYIWAGMILAIGISINAQPHGITPDLSKVSDHELWTIHNRELIGGEAVHLDARPGDGMLLLNGYNFSNGNIEVDIKGKDERGKSFVGLAFHVLNDSTFDAIYFRPFNFKSPERGGHSVQYISHPQHTWYNLRENHPEKYENPVQPVPDPTGWFHATIIIKHPVVKVFVNHADEPSLVVNQLSTAKEGQIGFWTGHGSEGEFRNLKIEPDSHGH